MQKHEDTFRVSRTGDTTKVPPTLVKVSELRVGDLILVNDMIRRVEGVEPSTLREGKIAVIRAMNPEVHRGRAVHAAPDREFVKVSEPSDLPREQYELWYGGTAIENDEGMPVVWHSECSEFHRPEAQRLDITHYVGIALGKCALCAETVRG